MRDTVRGLTDAGLRVMVVLDVPRFERRVPECTIRRSDCDVSLADATGFRAAVADAEVAAVASLATPAAATAWDPFDVLCDDRRCPGVADGVVRYRDTDHLSEAGAAFVQPAMTAALDEFLAREGTGDD
jgi:hypothetical protein